MRGLLTCPYVEKAFGVLPLKKPFKVMNPTSKHTFLAQKYKE